MQFFGWLCRLAWMSINRMSNNFFLHNLKINHNGYNRALFLLFHLYVKYHMYRQIVLHHNFVLNFQYFCWRLFTSIVRCIAKDFFLISCLIFAFWTIGRYGRYYTYLYDVKIFFLLLDYYEFLLFTSI